MNGHPQSCCSTIVAAFLCFALACGGAAAEDTPPTADQIAEWIAQLDSNQYQVREEATRHLVSANVAALEALASAANGDRPEPADRAVWILQRLAETKDVDVRRNVLERLARIDKQPQVAAQAQDELAQIRHDAAVRAILKLGGHLRDQPFNPMMQRAISAHVILDDNWRGGDDGVKHVQDIRELSTVTIIGSNVTRAGLEELQGVGSLRELHLYGSRLQEADVEALKKVLPGVTIDFNRGALLGIRGNDVGPAQVVFVQPGSAAAAANLRRNDVIQKLDGQPVLDFADLRSKIGKHRPGDEVALEIDRGGKTIEMKVKLGRWKTL